MRIQIRQPRPAVRTAKLCVGRRTAGIRRTGVSAGVSTRSAGRFSGRRAGKAEGGNGLHIHLESIWMSNGCEQLQAAEQATALSLLDERISKYTIEYNGTNLDGCFDEINA
jgi:hypothetical protein